MKNNLETQEEVPEFQDIEEMVENIVPGLSLEEYEKIRKEAIEEAKKRKHTWVMKGRGKLICTSCTTPHTAYIPTNKTLIGIAADGSPILKDI